MKLNQEKRNQNLLSKTKKMWSEISIDITPAIGRRMLQVFARDQLINLRQSETCSQLGYFSTDINRWKILNLIIHRSAKGEPFYKSQAIKLLKLSSRSFDKIIKDAVSKIPENEELGEKMVEICLVILAKAVKLTKTDMDDQLLEVVTKAIKNREE